MKKVAISGDKQRLALSLQQYADICPLSVFFFRREERAVPEVRYPDECWHCNACGLDCPQGAVSLQIPLNYMLLRIEASQLKQTKE